MKLFLPLPGLWSKSSFAKHSPNWPSSKFTFKTGNGFIQTGNGIISLSSKSLIKNSFYKVFHIWSKEFKINFQNRKWIYPNRKWNSISNFKASDQKPHSIKCFIFDPKGSKSIFETENGFIQTGNGIFSPTSELLIKKLLFPTMNKLSEDGVNMQKGKLVRYIRDCKWVQHRPDCIP